MTTISQDTRSLYRVQVLNLTDGFNFLERVFYPQSAAESPIFRGLYTKDYRFKAWDKRQKVFENSIEKKK